MHRLTRALPLVVAMAAALTACSRRQRPAAPAATPVSTAADDSAARERARLDSIAAADRTAADRANSERADRERRLADARNMLTAAIYFDYDRADITDDSRAKLDAKVPVLAANPGMRIRIAGHTDARGSDEYNLALGQRRASAAKRYLTQQGIDGARIDVVSFGEERPAAQGADEAAYAENRRAEFEILTGGDNLTLPVQ
jgi:peptidoglycan-associated lipoprotein